MNTHKISAPLSQGALAKLNSGDIVYITGTMFTLRDLGHRKALEEKNVKMPSNVLYHCGPIVKKNSGGKWEVLSAGPTTSARMNSVEGEFIRRFGIAAIIGKGGMGKEVADEMRGRCVYLSFTGGCGALAAKKLKVRSVKWLKELGMAEALWEFKAENFGPLIVGIDSGGKSLYRLRQN